MKVVEHFTKVFSDVPNVDFYSQKNLKKRLILMTYLKDKTNRATFKYNCGWCGHTFKKEVGTSGGITDQLGRTSKKVSSQVRCPMCRNFLPTWSGE